MSLKRMRKHQLCEDTFDLQGGKAIIADIV